MKLRSLSLLAIALLIGLALTGTVLALVGDLDISGTVDNADMSIVTSAYGSRGAPSPSANWDWRADINRDGFVNLSDLILAGRNYSDTFNFHWPRRVSNGLNQNPANTEAKYADAAVDSRGHVHVVWQEGTLAQEPLYYTQLDAAGNTVVEDVLLSNDSDEPRLAVDAQDNVHIFWQRRFSATGGWYAKLDAQGRTVIAPRRVLVGTYGDDYVALATDGYGHPHLLKRDETTGGRLLYSILDSHGNELISNVRLNPAFTATYPPVFGPAISVDRLGHRHVLWKQYASPGNCDLVYTRLISGGLPSPNQITIAHIALWSDDRMVIQADSLGAAHVLWEDYRGDGYAIYWRRINPDGTMTAGRQVAKGGNSSLTVRFVIDGNDRIHLVALDSDGHARYARLDRDGNVLVSFRAVAYTQSSIPVITVGPDGVAMLIYTDNSNHYQPHPLVVMSTLPDAAANDMTRADLVLDAAHLWASPRIARIIDSATVTATVANGGWVTASNIVVNFTETISNTPIAPATIASLPPFSSTTVVRTFAIPDLEDTSLLPIRISASTATPETTLTNNAVTTTLGVLPPAHSVDLGVAVFDESYAPNDRSLAAYLIGGQLSLAALPPVNYTAQVTSTQSYNYFTGVPLGPSGGAAKTTTMVLTLTAPGFSTSNLTVTATRDIQNPYVVHITPLETGLYINQWGIVRGTVYSGTASIPVSLATVTLDAGASTTTDASGVFTFTKVVSGSHSLEALRAGYLPATKPVSVRTGETAAPEMPMQWTKKGFVRGTVLNDWGQPFAGASVQLWAGGAARANATTGGDGRYALEIPNAGAYAAYEIHASAATCDPYVSGAFALTAGIPHNHDFTLHLTVSAGDLNTSGEVKSWELEERWNKPDYDSMPLGSLRQAFDQEIQGELGSYAYEVDTWWAKYQYALALNYTEAGGVKSVDQLIVGLKNMALYSYSVQGGPYKLGVSDINLTNLRVDWVDLVEVDDVGNVAAGPYGEPDATQWYANQTDGSMTVEVYSIGKPPANWSNAAIRVFFQVGEYDPSRPAANYWARWEPPVAVASLTGSGSGAGADFQCILWRLNSNQVEIIKSAPYYADAVERGGPVTTSAQVPVTAAAEASPRAGVIVSLNFPTAPPAYVGTPFAVDVSLSGATARPVYGVEFDLRFNPAHLQVQSVEGAPDFLGPYGTWVVLTPTLPIIDASGRLTDTAVVRLGAPGGITQGRLARITFSPMTSVASTALDLSGVWLADEGGGQFNADSILDASLRISARRVYLPMVVRGLPYQ